MMAHVEIIVKDQRLKEYGLPKFATTGSAGLDLRALERVELGSGDQHAFNLGFAIALPFGSFALLAPRSSLGIRGIHLANLVGIIDSDYQGECHRACLGSFRGPLSQLLDPSPRRRFEMLKL